MTTTHTGHLPPEHLPAFPDDGEPMFPSGLDVLVTEYDDGSREVAVRPGRDAFWTTWGVPVPLVTERTEEVPC